MPPSTVIDAPAALSRAITPERLVRQLRGDVDAIALKALALDPAQRYRSAAELGDDLRRFLQNRAVNARGAMAAPVASRASIAVLPLVDLSARHAQEYLADGLSEELIDRLAQIKDLKVIARTSAFKFKTAQQDLRRISARVLRVADGKVLWTRQFDRKEDDILAIRDEISAEVAATFGVARPNVVDSEATNRTDVYGHTENVAAYRLLARAQSHIRRMSREDLDATVALYRQAIEADPHYARAYAGLATALMTRATHGWAPEEAAWKESESALQRSRERSCAGRVQRRTGRPPGPLFRTL